MGIYDNLYRRLATLSSVYDGDSITLTIDLGDHLKMEDRVIRLYGIDCPEVRALKKNGTPDQIAFEKAAGLKARDRARELLSAAVGPLVVQTIKRPGKPLKDKYGRVLGRIEIPLANGVSVDLTTQLLTEGHGVPYAGGARPRPWVPMRALEKTDQTTEALVVELSLVA